MQIISELAKGMFDVCLYGAFFLALPICLIAIPVYWTRRTEEENYRAIAITVGMCLFFGIMRFIENTYGAITLFTWLAPIAVVVLLAAYLAIPLLIVAIADRWDKSYRRDNRTSDDVHYIKAKIQENVEAREQAQPTRPLAESLSPVAPPDKR